MSLKRGHSCVLCQQRKVRYDQQKPCANCVRAQVECGVVAPQPVRRRKKKLHERDLVERPQKHEILMAQNGIDFDSVLDSREVAHYEEYRTSYATTCCTVRPMKDTSALRRTTPSIPCSAMLRMASPAFSVAQASRLTLPIHIHQPSRPSSCGRCTSITSTLS